MPAPTVFVSYSHRDEEWKDKLLPHLYALESAGVEMQVWHDRRIDGGEKWYPEIQDAMANAAAAILMISADFLASRFCVHEEGPFLLSRQEEQGMLLIPLLLRPCLWKAHRWLKDRQMIPPGGKSVTVDFAEHFADTVFTAVAEQVWTHFDQLAARPGATLEIPQTIPHVRVWSTLTPDPRIIPPPNVVPWPALPAERVDLTRLPDTGSALFERDEELALWASPPKEAGTRILAFTAFGGVGKSTLVNHWLADMERERYRGATRVFGWTFYSQGARYDTSASSDTFIDAALRFFGDADPTAGSPWDKGERLAHIVGGQRALLVLDGLEPLQSAHSFERGKLRDPALASLLRGLARHSDGLCLITTREPLVELAGRSGMTMRDLEQITPQAGRALLRTARVVGRDAELEGLASRFGPHALAVSLLGVYLYEQPGHGTRPAEALEQLPSGEPIDRVLAGFEQWLGNSPEREALQLLGLFDRPADAGCLRALREAPAIPGLTDSLAGLGDAEWSGVLARLQELRLIHVFPGGPGQRFDAHPLVREYFARQVRTQHPEAWRAAHRRLYGHLCATTPDKVQPTLEDLQPLYQAVAHGCQARWYGHALKVYEVRILRRSENYSITKLGAFGADLGALTWFFEEPWSRVTPSLSEDDQSFLLNCTGSCLHSLGRLDEAVGPSRASMNQRLRLQDWAGAAASGTNLNACTLELGYIGDAVRDAEQFVASVEVTGNLYQKMYGRPALGNALLHAGRWGEAEQRFHEAEEIQRQLEPQPLLYWLQGFQYCDLLLTSAERAAWQMILSAMQTSSAGGDASTDRSEVQACRDVAERATQTLRWALEDQKSLYYVALDRLTLGRAALYAAILEKLDVRSAKPDVHQAVADLRRAGQQQFLPPGLLTRAWLRSLEGDGAGAQSDLDEAWEIAERGPMRLHMADIHLHRARLFFREKSYPWESPQTDLARARELIERCGYWRRKEELEDAEAITRGSGHDMR